MFQIKLNLPKCRLQKRTQQEMVRFPFVSQSARVVRFALVKPPIRLGNGVGEGSRMLEVKIKCQLTNSHSPRVTGSPRS